MLAAGIYPLAASPADRGSATTLIDTGSTTTMTAPAPDASPKDACPKASSTAHANLGNPLGPGPPAASVANPVRVLGDARPAPELVHECLDARNRICNELPQLAFIDRLLEAPPEALPLLMGTHAPIVSPGNVSSGLRRVHASPAPRVSLALGGAQPSDNRPGAHALTAPVMPGFPGIPFDGRSKAIATSGRMGLPCR